MLFLKEGHQFVRIETVGSSAALENLQRVVGWTDTSGSGHQSGSDQKLPARRMKGIVCPGGQHRRGSSRYW